ncbi:MAG: nucleotidyl transferase AbiEii/AbiGii toxin family protein [bacterium]|nr:nucleotidyl transferase AbiEii/AbiGii toxin family protein [bacterium]
MFTKTLFPDTLRAIQLVSGLSEVNQAYLAGGTALALQIGHRISVDLDFEDAEQEKQMPQMLSEVNWEEVKEYFQKETKTLAEKKIQS